MMSSLAPLSERTCPPSLALYNVRYLSLSDNLEQRKQWKRKVDNVQKLVEQSAIVGVLGTHVDALTV